MSDNKRSNLVDGESIIGPPGVHQKFVCCDCGLVHDLWPSYDPTTIQVSIMFVRNDKDTKPERTRLRRNRIGVFKHWPRPKKG